MVHIRKTFSRFLIAGVLAVLPHVTHTPATVSFAAPAQPQATPIVGGTSFGGAVQVSAGIEYVTAISSTHTTDTFFIDAQPGQIIHVDAASGVDFTGQGINIELHDQDHAAYLERFYYGAAEQNHVMDYMGNNSTPTRYYLRTTANGSATYEGYQFKITLTDQQDASQNDDAGDSGLNARTITPILNNLNIYTGTLGGKDAEDWLRIAARPGLVVSLTLTVDDYGTNHNNARADLYDEGSTQAGSPAQVFKSGAAASQIRWTANNTKPAAYLLKLSTNGQNGTPLRYRVALASSQQADADIVGDAGDIAGNARVISPTLGSSYTYTGALSGSDVDDWYRVNAISGQRITVTIVIDDFNNSSGATITLLDNASTQLATKFLSASGGDRFTTFWMSNSQIPSAYLIKINNNSSNATQDTLYHIIVELGQQTDTTQTGDAPDSFDTARPISATPDYLGNQIGFSDKDDFFKMQVPQDVLNTPYKFFLKDVSWPANSTGKLTIRRYSDNRQQLGQDIVINAPATETGQFDICNGCFVRVSYDDKFVVGYNVRLLVIKTVYLPFLQK